MNRMSVLDFFGVVRIVGYAFAVLMALIAVVTFVLGQTVPLLQLPAAPTAPFILCGLVVAWTAGLSRVFVRRMRFYSSQDDLR